MLNLCLHCGGRHVDRTQIETSTTPRATETWVPVPHHRLLEQVESTLIGNGLTIVNQAHALWQDGLRYFGLLEVHNGQADRDYSLVIGLRNSHDKSFPAAIGLGSGVFVCDNLAFSAEVTIARRHTRFIERDLPRVVHTAVGRLADLRGQQTQRIQAYRATPLADATVHDLVIRAVDARVLPVTQVPDVLQEWRTPRHPEFTADGKTAWRSDFRLPFTTRKARQGRRQSAFWADPWSCRTPRHHRGWRVFGRSNGIGCRANGHPTGDRRVDSWFCHQHS